MTIDFFTHSTLFDVCHVVMMRSADLH